MSLLAPFVSSLWLVWVFNLVSEVELSSGVNLWESQTKIYQVNRELLKGTKILFFRKRLHNLNNRRNALLEGRVSLILFIIPEYGSWDIKQWFLGPKNAWIFSLKLKLCKDYAVVSVLRRIEKIMVYILSQNIFESSVWMNCIHQ